MCGIGRAHLDMKKFVEKLHTPEPASDLLNVRVELKDIYKGEEKATEEDSLVSRLVEEELATNLS